MARRKDHTSQELRDLLLTAAQQIIIKDGVSTLTARALAAKVGYAAGTIYNIFPDMEAVVLAVHGQTLGGLQRKLEEQVARVPVGVQRIHALAHAYCRYAADNPQLWLAVFASPRRGVLPRWYQRQLQALFRFIERHLRQCLGQGVAESRRTARLLWACLHGITLLMLDGRLHIIGRSEATAMVEALLRPYHLVNEAESKTMREGLC